MKYISFEYENEKFWIEIGADGYALRQIIVDSNNCSQVSCFEDCLSEGKIDEYDLDCEVNDITACEFQVVWNELTCSNRKKWESVKNKVKIDQTIQGKVLYRYPQGWILQTNDSIALCDGKLELNVGQIISGKIRDYNEENMWLLLNEIKVQY